MKQSQLVRQLKSLRELKPSDNWVAFTKERIFAAEPEPIGLMAGLLSFFPIFRYKLTLVPILSVLVLIGLFGFTQNTIPGDFLFSVKKMTESAQVNFSSSAEKPTTQLKLANKRLEELSRIADDNQVKNLDPTIKEFQSNIAQAIKDLAAFDINVTSSDPLVIKGLLAETKKMTENKEKVESVLGAVIGDTGELDNAILQIEKQTAAYLINDLENRTLSDSDGQLLGQAKDDFNAGSYATSLEKIWILSNK
ncbi:MAG: DUF5667 domain-containing protein [Candidatus Komeilibacteria bacterium]